jgi:hypothetical protein
MTMQFNKEKIISFTCSVVEPELLNVGDKKTKSSILLQSFFDSACPHLNIFSISIRKERNNCR